MILLVLRNNKFESGVIRESPLAFQLLRAARWVAIFAPWPLFALLFLDDLISRRHTKATSVPERARDPNDETRWFGGPASAKDYLLRSWDPTHPVAFYRETAEWSIGMSSTFRKSIAHLDKNLQGRALEALAVLCDAPLTPRSDTVRRLEGDLIGFWRYRIGDYRLIYHPIVARKTIILVEFTSRGEAYA